MDLASSGLFSIAHEKATRCAAVLNDKIPGAQSIMAAVGEVRQGVVERPRWSI